MTHSGAGHLLAQPYGVLGGRVLLRLGSSLHVQEGQRLPNSLCPHNRNRDSNILKSLLQGHGKGELYKSGCLCSPVLSEGMCTWICCERCCSIAALWRLLGGWGWC